MTSPAEETPDVLLISPSPGGEASRIGTHLRRAGITVQEAGGPSPQASSYATVGLLVTGPDSSLYATSQLLARLGTFPQIRKWVMISPYPALFRHLVQTRSTVADLSITAHPHPADPHALLSLLQRLGVTGFVTGRADIPYPNVSKRQPPPLPQVPHCARVTTWSGWLAAIAILLATLRPHTSPESSPLQPPPPQAAAALFHVQKTIQAATRTAAMDGAAIVQISRLFSDPVALPGHSALGRLQLLGYLIEQQLKWPQWSEVTQTLTLLSGTSPGHFKIQVLSDYSAANPAADKCATGSMSTLYEVRFTDPDALPFITAVTLIPPRFTAAPRAPQRNTPQSPSNPLPQSE
jgi:hypothetical protein